MRLVFLGTPEMAVPPLRALHAAGHDIALVVTRADVRRGRGGRTSPSPVKAAATELQIPVTHEIDDALDTDAELGVVVAYGRIIKPHILDATPMVNIHFSLLPRWRGAAPVERALMAGDAETGVCVMAVEEGLDTGGVYASEAVPIGPDTTASDLRCQLVDVGTRLLLDVLEEGIEAVRDPEPQQGEVTYAEKIDPAELELDWGREAIALHRLVRVGGAYTWFRDDRFKIHEADLVAATDVDADPGVPGALRDPSDGVVLAGDGACLRLRRVQPAGKPAMPWRDYANGAHPEAGERFGRHDLRLDGQC